MNTRAYRKICALLAASAFTEREIKEFAYTLEERNVARFIIDILYQRKQIQDSNFDFDLNNPYSHSTFEDEVNEKIERLLLIEAGLTKMQAIEKLSNELHKKHDKLILPRDTKKGFSAWITKVSEIVSPSELLHLATYLRNSFVNEPPKDWRLK